MWIITFVSIPKTIVSSSSKVFVTSRPATILEGFAKIVFFVVDSKSKILLNNKYHWPIINVRDGNNIVTKILCIFCSRSNYIFMDMCKLSKQGGVNGEFKMFEREKFVILVLSILI